MHTLSEEIKIVLAITVLLFAITFFVIVFVLISQHQHNKYLHEKEELKNIYQQELLRTRLEIQEQTLHYISQEIHDNIGQILSLVKLNLNTVGPVKDEKLQSKLINTKDLVGKALQDLRDLSKTLNTDIIIQSNFSEAIEFELESIQKTGACTTYMEVKGVERKLDAQKQIIIFRIAQEVLNNIIKHAKAQEIQAFIDYRLDSFELIIKDDGTGFDMEELKGADLYEKGSGINNIYTRAKMIQAEVTINSIIQEGTTFRLFIPTTSTI
ncbi:sensor histidine kinase [Xanthocytophaga agilis]|uniref:histidine kinase n=1 Tax=Xanthocytophaga agilis TaxID=3048010 RepID=A0AAE3UGK0_9BACT|nr:ATP-binding protein [Xanthocytophaga agilis]MDJ1504465.1 histidine kinase [Xanthocytophaga agilis]